MVTSKDMIVVLPCLFKNSDPLWMMLHSCKRFGIEPYLYGLGETYQGWVHLKIKLLRDAAKKMLESGFSHLYYVDARDAWFCSGLDEVAEKYNKMGCPDVLLSAQRRPFCGGYGEWYYKYSWNKSLKFAYIGTPGILADAKKLMEIFTYMLDTYPFGVGVKNSLPDDDPPWWINYMLDFPGAVKMDHDCNIFINVGDMSRDEWEIKDGRVLNKLTGTQPCTIHFNGGASHWLRGKWESLEKYWKIFGYEERPPWEGK